MLGSVLLQLFSFFSCHGHISIAHLVEQTIHVFFVFCHRLNKRLVGIAVFAKQLGELKTCIGDVDDDGGIVELATYTA